MANFDDLKQERLIQKELQNAGIPQNKLNSLLKMLDNQIKCGPVCQKNQRDENLKRMYDNAVTNYAEAPFKVKNAEKKYYETTKGSAFYDDMLKDRYSNEIKNKSIQLIKEHKDKVDEIKLSISNYETQVIYSSKIEKLLKKVIIENDYLRENVDKYKASVQTNDRKTFYEDQQIQNLDKWKNIIFKIFWILFILLVINVFVIKQKYFDYTIWIKLVLLLIFPFYLFPLIYHFLIKIKNKMYLKDVYTDLK